MALMDVISGLSSFATLHSWINEQFETIMDYKKGKKLDDISIEFKNNYLKKLKDEFVEEKVDKYIAESTSDFSTRSIIQLFSDDEREKVILDFFEKNPQLQYRDKEKIISILNEYLDTLSKYLTEKMNYDSKIIIKTVRDGDKAIYGQLKEIKDSLSVQNVYHELDLSKKIISKCNALNALLLNNLHINLWIKDINEDFLTGNSLTDIIMRIKSFFELLNKKEFNNISGAKCENSIEALFNMIKVLTPDLSIDLNTFYYEKIVQTLVCINGFLEKSESYYMSIGALGLFNDNSEENIFKCIMNNLLSFVVISFSTLDNLWRDRDYKKIENEVSNKMHQYLLQHIKLLIDNDRIKFVKTIYDNKSILDLTLAEMFSCNVNELRKKLYRLTETFLLYEYNDNSSTKLFISGAYTKTFEKYYNEIFGEVKNES